MTIPNYVYRFGDLRTGAALMEIPLESVDVSNKLNGLGDMRGGFRMDTTGYSNSDLLSATIPGRTNVLVLRNNIPIWDGFITSRWYQSDAKLMQFYAKHIKNWGDHHFVDVDFIYANVEQTQLFLNAWTQMQADPTRNVNITLPSAIATGVLASEEVHQYEFKTFGSIFDDIANGAQGFDWDVYTSLVNGNIVRNMSIGFPTLGAKRTPDSTVFEYFSDPPDSGGGSIKNYYCTENHIATHQFGLGAGSGDSILQSSQIDTDTLAAGGLRIDASTSFKDISNQTTLNQLTQQVFSQTKPSATPTFKVELKGDIAPEFGSYNLGDSCGLFIQDCRFPSGEQFDVRLIAWDFKPASNDTQEAVSLTFQGDDSTD